MKKHLFLIFFIAVLQTLITAQTTYVNRLSFNTRANNMYDNPEDSVLFLRFFSQSADGNSLIYCYTDRDKSEIRKIDLAGNSIFEIPVTVSQGSNKHDISGLNATPDSGLIFADNLFVPLSGNSYSYLKKFSKNGILEWSTEIPKIQNSSGIEQITFDIAIIPGGYAALAMDSLYFLNDTGRIVKAINTSGPGSIIGFTNGDLLIRNQQFNGRMDSMLNMIYTLQAGNHYYRDTYLYRVNGDTLYKVDLQTGMTGSAHYLPDASLYNYSILSDGGWIAYKDKTINYYDENGNIKWSNYAQLTHFMLGVLGEQSDGTILYGGTYLSAEVPNDIDYSIFIATIDSMGISIADTTTQVYPGDADDDNILEFSDIVYIALAQGISGPPRIDTSLLYIAPYMVGDIAVNFESTFGTGVNHNQCDVVPDGKIDSLDIEFLGIFGLAHQNTSTNFRKADLFQENKNSKNPIPSFSCLPDQDSANIGDTVRFYFVLGENGFIIDSIYGIACNLILDSLPSFNYYASRVNITNLDNDLSPVSNQRFWTYHPWTFHLSFLQARKDWQNSINISTDTIGFADVCIHDIYSPNPELRISCLGLKAITASGFPVELQYNTRSVYLRSTVSTISSDTSKSILIFPNPFQDKINLKQLPEKNISIHIYDLTGKECIKMLTSNKREFEIPTRSLANGSYLLELKKEGISVFSKKFIKQ